MARLTLQLAGPWVVPITTPRQFLADSRIQSLVEAGLAGDAGHSPRRDDLRERTDWNGIAAAAPRQGHVPEAPR